MAREIREKISALGCHLLDVCDMLASNEFESKPIEEKRFILDKAKTLQKTADTITKLAGIELSHRALDLQQHKPIAKDLRTIDVEAGK